MLGNDVVNIRAIRIAVANVSFSPSGQRSAAVVRWIIRHQPVVMVFHIDDPRQLELFDIVQADDGLGFGSGARKGGQ